MKELFFSLYSFMAHDCLVGNIEQSEAESIVKHIEDTLFNAPNSLCKTLFPSQYMSRRTVMLEKGLKYYHQTEGSNQKDENSALIQYIQVQYYLCMENIVPIHCAHVYFICWYGIISYNIHAHVLSNFQFI